MKNTKKVSLPMFKDDIYFIIGPKEEAKKKVKTTIQKHYKKIENLDEVIDRYFKTYAGGKAIYPTDLDSKRKFGQNRTIFICVNLNEEKVKEQLNKEDFKAARKLMLSTISHEVKHYVDYLEKRIHETGSDEYTAYITGYICSELQDFALDYLETILPR